MLDKEQTGAGSGSLEINVRGVGADSPKEMVGGGIEVERKVRLYPGDALRAD